MRAKAFSNQSEWRDMHTQLQHTVHTRKCGFLLSIIIFSLLTICLRTRLSFSIRAATLYSPCSNCSCTACVSCGDCSAFCTIQNRISQLKPQWNEQKKEEEMNRRFPPIPQFLFHHRRSHCRLSCSMRISYTCDFLRPNGLAHHPGNIPYSQYHAVSKAWRMI